MIEKEILDFISSRLNVPVMLERPEEPPTSYVLIEKTGSSERNHIKKSTIACQSYDASLYKTVVLNELVKTSMKELIELDIIISSKLNSDYNYTKLDSKEYRYQAVFDVTHY